MRRRLVLALTGALFAFGCGAGPQVASPPPAPSVSEPKLLVPGDLDLVIRLDLARLRDLLGQDFERSLEELLKSTKSSGPDGETARRTLALLTRSDTAWIGVRPGLRADLTDNVIVLRGDFRDVLSGRLGGDPPWGGSEDLGGGVLKFAREAPRHRSAPAVLYLRASDLVVMGSYAELDALERTLEQGRGDPPLEPPDSGIASLAARLGWLRERLRERAPTVGRVFEGAQRLTAIATWNAGELDLRFELVLDSTERARELAAALRGILQRISPGLGPERAWVGQGSVEAVEQFVTARFRVPLAELARGLSRFSERGPNSDGTVPPP